MIPIRSESRINTRPVTVWLLTVACTAVLVRLATLPAPRAGAIVSALGVVPARLAGDPLAPDQLVTLVTSCFLHAGWVHLAGNMLFLLVFGPVVEDRLGRLGFIGLYLAAGVSGALAHVYMQPDSLAPLVGASGAIAGVLGAHVVLAPRSRVVAVIPVFVVFEVASLPAAFVIALWFVAQLASALAPVTGDASNVAWFAHLGGFAVGGVLALPAALRAAVRARRSRRSSGERPGTRRRRAA